MHGECRNLTNENIGPVPADETLRIDFPKDSSAAFLTVLTNGSDSFVLAAASPWILVTTISPKPFCLRCFFSRSSCFSGSIFGINRKSIFTSAFDGNTVFAPGPSYPDVNPAMLHDSHRGMKVLAQKRYYHQRHL